LSRVLVAYVSGHGYGHATRCAQVLRAVRLQAPGTRITVVSSAPRSRFAPAIPGEFAYRHFRCDVGLLQRDALVIDLPATVDACRSFAAEWPDRLEAEVSWLRESGAAVVLGDVPPLAFAAAAATGIPSVAVTNFSWDWIYRHLAASEPALAEAADQARSAYAPTSLLLRLPFAGDLSAFPRIEDVPLVARLSRMEAGEARRRLGLGPRPVVLLSFGGIGLRAPAPEALAALPDFDFLVEALSEDAPRNAHSVDDARLAALGLGYEDVVTAADVVVTKPGYGIVTDAIAARTRIVYTERGDFPEYPILVAEMGRYVPSVHASNADVRAGRLGDAIGAVLAMPFPALPRLDGAEVAARRLVGLL
jgi:L-arabinokinase